MNFEKNPKLNILCLRNLGDSYIQRKVIEEHLVGNGIVVNIFCRNANLPVFNDGKFKVLNIEITPTIKFLFKWKELLAAIKLIKRQNGIFITFFGDWLELILLTLSGVRFIYPIWPKSHYLRKILRIPKFRYPFGLGVDICAENLYLSFEEYARSISSLHSRSSKLHEDRIFQLTKSINPSSEAIVTFSPIGSLASKTISRGNIVSIIELCNSMDYTVVVMCSESQKDELYKFLNKNIKIKFCTDITAGISFVKTSRFYIGVDTFWTHVSISNNIPSLLFSGGIPAKYIYPKFVNELTFGDRCEYYPCYNFAPCRNDQNSFVCIGSGLQDLVLMRVREFLTNYLLITCNDKHDYQMTCSQDWQRRN